MTIATVMILLAAWSLIYLLVLWREKRSATRPGNRTLRQDWASIGALALATLAFFWRQIFTGTAWVPAGGGDLASFIYPMLQFTGRYIKAGILPLWNPYLYGGSPFASDIQSMLFYPINWPFLLLSREVTYRLVQNLAFFHVFLAGVAMYLCLRHLNRSPLRSTAAQAGAVAYMFSGVFLIHLGNLNMIAVAAWLPLVFLFFHRSLARASVTQAVLAALFLTVAALAGHVQILFFTVILLGGYTVYWIATQRPSRATQPVEPEGSNSLQAIALLFLTLGVTAALSAIVILPWFEMSQFVKRSALSYRDASAYSLPPAKLIGMLVPAFFERDPALHWGPWDRVEVGYLGILTLVLAALAIFLRRNRLNLFFLFTAIAALFVAFGGYSIVHGWLYELLPGFDRLRAPARTVLLMDFALAALAAQALDVLMRPLPPSERRTWRALLQAAPWLFAATVLLTAPLAYYTLFLGQEKDPVIFHRIAQTVNGVLLFLVFLGLSLLLLAFRRWRWIRPVGLGVAASLLILVDLGSTGAYLDTGRKAPTQGFDHPEIISFLKQDTDLYRIDSRTGIWHLWQPDTPLLHDIADVWGVVNPLTLSDYDRYWENMGSRSSPLYDFLNAKYVIAAKDVELDWDKFSPVFDGESDLSVYLNRGALPRAFTVTKAAIVPDQEAAFQAIHQEDFDPSTSVVVEGGPQLSATHSSQDTGTVEVVSYAPNRVELDVNMPEEGYLVLSEVYYPGWQAKVDGRSTPIFRANYAFRSIFLDSGSHRVVMTYRPATWYVGLGITIVTLLVLAIWSVVRWRRRR